MNNSYLIIGLILVSIIIIYRRTRSKSQDLNLTYIKRGDPTAQENYESSLKPKKLLTKDERLELSWQFLYDITDVVLNKFPEEDRKQVHEIGHKMLDVGCGYEHVIEYGLKKEKEEEKTKELEKEQDLSADKTRSV